MMALFRWLLAALTIFVVESAAVLDPALYLSPSPPMTLTSDSISPGELWTQPLTARRERDAENFVTPEEPTTTEPKELTGRGKSFWPGLRATDYSIRGIHIPLTFSISGTYGTNYGGFGTGVLGSSYASVSSDDSSIFGSYGKSTLAGSSYGNYRAGYPGVRIFGGAAKTGWSGWGNGKWGHYGKG